MTKLQNQTKFLTSRQEKKRKKGGIVPITRNTNATIFTTMREYKRSTVKVKVMPQSKKTKI